MSGKRSVDSCNRLKCSVERALSDKRRQDDRVIGWALKSIIAEVNECEKRIHIGILSLLLYEIVYGVGHYIVYILGYSIIIYE